MRRRSVLASCLGLAALIPSAAQALSWEDSAQAVVKVIALGEVVPLPGPVGVPLAVPQATHGSGVVVARDCLVVTSAHGVAGAAAVAVRFGRPDRVYAAVVAHVSRSRDLAVLVVDRDVCAPFVAPVDADPPTRGMTVMKVGFAGGAGPEGLRARQPSVARGVVGRRVDVEGQPMLEIYVPVDPGDSGGLVCDEEGRLVGLVRGRQRDRDAVGFAIMTPVVGATLYEATSSGAVERARRELKDPTFAATRLVAEVGGALVEAEPTAAAGLLGRPELGASLRQTLALTWRGHPAGRWLLASFAASAGALRALEPARPARDAGCTLLERAREIMTEVHRAHSTSAPRAFLTQLAAATAPMEPLGRACGPAPAAAALAPAAPAAVGERAAPSTWRGVLGERTELYARWSLSVLGRRGEAAPSAASGQVGGTLPCAVSGRLGLGLALGLAVVDATVGLLVRMEVPFRVDYGQLFVDAGLAVGALGRAQVAGDRTWDGVAGALLRVGVRKTVQLGLEASALGGGGGALLGFGFFVGVGW